MAAIDSQGLVPATETPLAAVAPPTSTQNVPEAISSVVLASTGLSTSPSHEVSAVPITPSTTSTVSTTSTTSIISTTSITPAISALATATLEPAVGNEVAVIAQTPTADVQAVPPIVPSPSPVSQIPAAPVVEQSTNVLSQPTPQAAILIEIGTTSVSTEKPSTAPTQVSTKSQTGNTATLSHTVPVAVALEAKQTTEAVDETTYTWLDDLSSTSTSLDVATVANDIAFYETPIASTTPGLIVSNGAPRVVEGNSANAEGGSTTTKVGNLSVYGLVGIIAAILIIAAGSFIAWDKWRKKKIAATSTDPFVDEPKANPPSHTSSQGSVLTDPVYFPHRSLNRANMDGTSSFWNDSSSTQIPNAQPAGQGAHGPLLSIPTSQAGRQSKGSSWYTSLPTPFGSVFGKDPIPDLPKTFQNGAIAETGGTTNADLLGYQWNARDDHRLTAATGLTAMTSTSSQLDMMSTYASQGEERATLRASQFPSPSPSPLPMGVSPTQSRPFTQISASSVYSPGGDVSPGPPLHKYSAASPSEQYSSKLRKGFQPLLETDEEIEEISSQANESTKNPFEDMAAGTALADVSTPVGTENSLLTRLGKRMW